MKALIYAILILTPVMAGWSVPTPITGSQNVVRSYDSFTNEDGKTYVAFCTEKVDALGNVTQGLSFAVLDVKDRVLKSSEIGIYFGCRAVKISGIPNRKRLAIAFEGRRKVGMTLCSFDFRQGCYDIFTTTSSDLGETWSPAISVKRNNQQDVIERFNPHFILQKNLDRIFLFYTRRELKEQDFQLSYVSSGVDLKFDTEITIYSSVGKRLLEVVKLQEKLKYTIHVFYETEDNIKHICANINNLGLWQELSDIGESKDHYSRFISLEGEEKSMLAAIYTDGIKSFTKYSFNKGETWNIAVIDEKYHKYATGRISKKDRGEYELAVLTAGFMNKELTFKIINITEKGNVEGDSPFTTISNYGIFMPQLNSYLDKWTIYKAIGHIWCNGTAPAIYVSTFSI